MAYPQNVVSSKDNPAINGGIIPPIISVTIGSLYIKKHCIIESLSYTVVDEGGWTLNKLPVSLGGGEDWKSSLTYADADMDKTNTLDYWVLPNIIDVSISLKFLESTHNTIGTKPNPNLYSFGKTLTN